MPRDDTLGEAADHVARNPPQNRTGPAPWPGRSPRPLPHRRRAARRPRRRRRRSDACRASRPSPSAVSSITMPPPKVRLAGASPVHAGASSAGRPPPRPRPRRAGWRRRLAAALRALPLAPLLAQPLAAASSSAGRFAVPAAPRGIGASAKVGPRASAGARAAACRCRPRPRRPSRGPCRAARRGASSWEGAVFGHRFAAAVQLCRLPNQVQLRYSPRLTLRCNFAGCRSQIS